MAGGLINNDNIANLPNQIQLDDNQVVDGQPNINNPSQQNINNIQNLQSQQNISGQQNPPQSQQNIPVEDPKDNIGTDESFSEHPEEV